MPGQNQGQVMRGVPGAKEQDVARLRVVVRRVEPLRARTGEPFRHYGRLRPPRCRGCTGREVQRREPSGIREHGTHETVTAHATTALGGIVHERRSIPRARGFLEAGEIGITSSHIRLRCASAG